MTTLAVQLLADELELAWAQAGESRTDTPRHLAHETRDLADGRLRLAFATSGARADVDVRPERLASRDERERVVNDLLARLVA